MTRRFAVLILALALNSHARAGDVQALMRDTQRISIESAQATFVWWMPPAFWEAAMRANAMLSPEGRAQVLAALDDYIIFMIARTKSSMGTLDASSKSEMLSNARLEIGGKTIDPIAPEKLTPAAQALLASLKPGLAASSGNFGKAAEIVIYPSKQGNEKLIDPLRPGSFKYTLYDQTFTWRLPLGSLLPPKVDPKTNEEFPGDYEFSPYTGDPLRTK